MAGYAGEIQLIRQELPADERVNVIGRVDPRYQLLMDCIQRGRPLPDGAAPRKETPMHYKLLALDLDGTALSDPNTFAPGLAEAAAQAAAAGCTEHAI